jgi:hypothetical protein
MRTSKGLIITNQSFCHNKIIQSFETAELKLTDAETPREAIHDAFSCHPPPTPAPSRVGSLRATHHRKHYLDHHIIGRLSILILSKTYPLVISTSPLLDMKVFLATWLPLLKSNKE